MEYLVVIGVIVVILLVNYVSQNNFDNVPDLQTFASFLPGKGLDTKGCYDDLQICNTTEDGKQLCSNQNVNCGDNFEYQKSMCFLKQSGDRSQFCNSVVGVVPDPQSQYSIGTFTGF
jgi:hypothetical protein